MGYNGMGYNGMGYNGIGVSVPERDKDILAVRAQALATDGSGVARSDGVVIFVPGLLPGAWGRVQVTERRKNFWRGELLEVVSPGLDGTEPCGMGEPEGQEMGEPEGQRMNEPQRQGKGCTRKVPPCPVFELCGGCDLQHMSYEDTLHWKKRWVEDALTRIARTDVHAGAKELVKAVIGMKEPWHYRNKATLHWDGSRLGYYGAHSYKVVEFENCLLLPGAMNEIVKPLGKLLAECEAEALSVIMRVDTAGQLVLAAADEKGKGQFAEFIRKAGTISDARIEEAVNRACLTYVIGGVAERVTFSVSPRSFLQVNTAQMHTLLRIAAEMASLKGDEVVWDLYSGVGALGLWLARSVREVVGIEENKQAVCDAEMNARHNGISNLRFIPGRVEDILKSGLRETDQARPDVVVADPPRTGLSNRVMEDLMGLQAKKILYVSCNPATLARDVGKMENYQVVDVQPIDMFPWTAHVECVILMSRKGCEKGRDTRGLGDWGVT
jgi:23S rRNA (uracil1939-C5)-methyltransferase